MKRNRIIDLQLFGEGYTDYGTSNFFKQTFEEMYTPKEIDNNTTTEAPSEGVQEPESVPIEDVVEIPAEVTETAPIPQESTPTPPNESPSQLTREEMLEAIKATQQAPALDEETQQALELMAYLKENPHLINAMREVNPDAHQQLNTYVPDEMTKKLQEFEEFMIEQQYQGVVRDMKTKYSDYDESKVLEFAEEHSITDLEVAYKALKADSTPTFDETAMRNKLREELKAELMQELKQTASNTSTIVGSMGDTPPVQNEVVVSQQEKKVARMMGMSADDYAKWRDNQ